MKCLLFLALALVSCLAYEKDGDVLVLGDSDLQTAIDEFEFLLVEFYAPWCGHCKSLAPEYAKAATTLSKLDTPIPIAKVDATEHSDAAAKYEVRGYPTLKWFVNGKAMDYGGGRTADTIVSWVQKKSGPAVKTLADSAAVDAFKASADVVVVGYMAADSDEFKAYEGAAKTNDDSQFAMADADAAKAAGAAFPSIVLYKTFDEGEAAFDGEYDSDAINTFVSENSVPLVSTFSQEAAPKIFGSGVDVHFLYFNKESADTHEATMGELRTVAPGFKGKTLFVYVPDSEARVMDFFGLKAADLPAAVLVQMGEGDMKKFAFDGEFNADAIKAHVDAYHNGELKPTLKSEEAPEDNSGPVTVVVGTTFEEIVMDTTKDVLLEFYAPWCGHCKSLAPTWDQLGEKFASSSNIVVAKIDATANDIDHPKVSVRGFPTILFFPADAKDSPSTYEGERDLDSLAAYLEENATTGVGSDEKGKDEL